MNDETCDKALIYGRRFGLLGGFALYANILGLDMVQEAVRVIRAYF